MIPPSVVNDGLWWMIVFCEPFFKAVLVMVELANVIEDDGSVLAMGLGVF